MARYQVCHRLAACALLVWIGSASAVHKCVGTDGSVRYQDAACPSNSKEASEILRPRNGTSGSGTKDSVAARAIPEYATKAVRTRCAKDWPSNSSKRADCEAQHMRIIQQAFDKAYEKALASPTGADDGIRRKCAADWPDDFRMRAYCEEQQTEALRTLAEPVGASGREAEIIRSKCARDWPDDFRMRVYCEKAQVDGLRQLR